MIMRRREFIRKTATGAAGITIIAGAGSLTSCAGADPDRKLILALIGSGARGIKIAKGICSEPNVTLKYVCDVSGTKADHAISLLSAALGYPPQKSADMKQILDDSEVDAVIIATPEHWNAPAAIRSCKAKKDVYVEACPSHCLWEGRRLAEASKKYKRIVQTGFQNRSSESVKSARAYIESGKLGPVVQVKAYNLSPASKWTASPDSEAPSDVNWDAWLGPAPVRPFNSAVNEGDWNKFWDFSGGSLSVKASHVLDMARAVTGNPGHPLSVYSCGGNRIWNSSCEIPEILEITWNYGKFVLTCMSGNGAKYMKKVVAEGASFPDWLRIPDRLEVYGTKGLMYIGQNGEGWQVIGPEDKILAEGHEENPEKAHFQNFINCIRSRTQPVANAEQGHLSASLVHLGNIAYRTGNKRLLFDGEKEEFINDPEAAKFLKNTYREAYNFPEKI